MSVVVNNQSSPGGERITVGRMRAVVVTCSLAVYLIAVRNHFAMDDVPIIASNALVHRWDGMWRAFLEPYWPGNLGGAMYRPLAIASYTVDWRLGSVAWLHAVNLVWHAGVGLVVAELVRHWTGSVNGALVAGIVFAVHPVHVEAVANIVGRAELMAALFTLLSVYAALAHDRLSLSVMAMALGLLSKENAAVAPLLIAWGWLLGMGRPSARRMGQYAVAWATVAVVYVGVRSGVLHASSGTNPIAAVFLGASPTDVRLTAVAALADVARLLVFPLELRIDYSPNERTIVTSPWDQRFLLGGACLVLWVMLVAWAWRRGKRVEAYGLGWIAIALAPVANLIFPTGVLVAERTLYLPSVGATIALGAWARHLSSRGVAVQAILVLLAGGARTLTRIPVFNSTQTAALSVLEDSPRSYVGPTWMATIYLAYHEPHKALEAIRVAAQVTDRAPLVYLVGADAAFALGRPRLADSMLTTLERACNSCAFLYEYEAQLATGRGDTVAAESLLARAHRRRPAP